MVNRCVTFLCHRPIYWLALVAPLFSQSPRSSIVGRVTDQSAAYVASAKVTVENQQTGISRSTVTAAEGEYTVPNLDPGLYRVTVAAAGFKANVRRDIVVSIDQTVRVDVALEVGDVNTRVEVDAAAPVVQTDASSVGNVVDGGRIKSMPLNGRNNLWGLLALAPGVQAPNMNPLIAGNGGFGASNLTIDGVSGNDIGNERNLQTVPTLEAIGEFKVIANGASAEFGQGGAQIVVVSKSGSNEYHGSLFYFNRNRVTAANNFFSNRAGLPRPPFNRNEYGASLGGPIRKNKLFFHGAFEGYRAAASQTIVTQMPTRALRSGDFSSLPAILDPFNNGAPFPGNRIPDTRIASVAKGLDKFFSDSNLAGTPPAGLGNNFTANVAALEPVDRFSVRGDYNLTDKDRLTGRFFRSANGPFNQTGAAFGANVGTDKFGNWGGFGNATNNWMGSYTRIMSPRLIQEARLGMQFNNFFRTPQNGDFDPSTLIPGLIKPVAGLGGLPTVNILGFRGFNDQPGSGDRQATYQLADNLTWTRDKHALKFGFEYERPSSFNRQNTPPYRGQFNFDGRYTGNPFADYLIGAASFTSRNTRNALNENVNSRYFAFAQDDWNLHPRLTINLGVRYEYESPFHNGVTPGDLANFDPASGKVVVIAGIQDGDPRLLGLPIVDGSKVGINSGNYTYPDRNNFAPRVGLAWRPLGGSRLVIRSSYSIFYNVIAGYNGMLGMGITNPPFRAQETFEPAPGPVPSLTWANPFPGVGTLPTNPALLAVARNRVNPYMQEWNFTTEYELARNTAVRASYIGNKGTHLERNANINEPLMVSGPVQPRRPYQPWGPITYWESGRNSILHQLQLGFVHRYTSGFTFQFEYQFSRALTEYTFGDGLSDNHNFRYDRGNQDAIRRHYAVTNYSYELPFGRGKKLLSGVTAPVNKVVGGWQVAGILTAGTGTPYSVTFTPTLLGWLPSRADVISYAATAPSNQSNDRWFAPEAFRTPQPFTFGNSARNALLGPGLVAWDSGVFKNTAITERIQSAFRLEFFNLPNRANFSNPASNISAPSSVGQITSTSIAARTIQLGMRLDF